MSTLPVGKLFLRSVIVSATAFSLWKLLRLALYDPYRSPLRRLRGPKGTSLILGNLNEVTKDFTENGMLIDQWVEEYGSTLRINGFLNNSQLITVDTCTLNHLLVHTNDYQKSADARYALGQIFGEGLLVVEGTQHRQQRRIMSPAFGPAEIRELTKTFLSRADRLRDLWFSEISEDPTSTIAGTRIDVVPWLNRATLDMIGLAGFNCNFDALDSNGRLNELSEALSTMFSASQKITLLDILQLLIPALRIIPTPESRKMRVAKRTMSQIGEQLLMEAKAAALTSATERWKGGNRTRRPV